MKSKGHIIGRTNRRNSAWVLLTAAAIAALPAMSLAAVWQDVSSDYNGDFSTAGHWDSGVPGASDTAIFSADETYAVTFGDSPTTSVAQVTDGDVTFNLATGKTYTVTATGIEDNASLYISGSATAAPSLTLTGGGTLAAQYYTVGGANGTGSSLTVTDGTTMTVSGVDGSYVGRITNAQLTIANGGKVISQNIKNSGKITSVGYNNTSTGNVLITGENSQWQLDTTLVIGSSGTGIAHVEDKGLLKMLTATTLGGATTGNGSLTITGTGTTGELEKLIIGSSGVGNMLVEDGAGAITAATMLGEKAAGDGTLTVTGSGTTFRASRIQTGILGKGTVLIEDGAVLTTTAGGATTSHSIGESIGSSGTVTITGAGSQWDFTGAATPTTTPQLTIGGTGGTGANGGAAGGTGVLNVTDGGSINMGTGSGAYVKIWNAGTLNLNKGSITTRYLYSFGGTINLVDDNTITRTGSGTGKMVLDDDTTVTTLLSGTGAGEFGRLTVAGSGDLTLDGTLKVLLDGAYMPTAGSVYDLFDWTGTLTGTFADIDLPTLTSGLTWVTSDLYTTGEISVAVPEPAMMGLLAVGGLLMLRRRRA